MLASTVPANGDLNPYGVAVVPTSSGRLVAGDVLVSNFNSKANVQGTGTTLVEVSPQGATQLFAQLSRLPAGIACPGGVGLTTALAILPGGWVVAGSLATAAQGALPSLDPVGCLLVLNSVGTPVETIAGPGVVGPWDMAVESSPNKASLFVSNALGGNTSTKAGVPVAGNCTVVRLNLSLSGHRPPKLVSSTVIGTGFPWRADRSALVLAPAGLALGNDGTLFVDDTETGTVSAIADATTRKSALARGQTILSGHGLNAPLGMVLAPNGDLVVVNGNDGNAVELTQRGRRVAVKTLVADGAGDLFGLAVTSDHMGLLFANDGTNGLDQVHTPPAG